MSEFGIEGAAMRSASCATLMLWLLSTTASGASEGMTILIVRRGWHVDIGFPADQLGPPLDKMMIEFPGARYVLFGFGDRRFITSTHHGIPALLQALWPGDGVLLVTGLRDTPQAAFGRENVQALRLTSSESIDSQFFVWKSLTDRQQNQLGVRESGIGGPYGGSKYFQSRNSYSATHTCNTWAAEVLQLSQPTISSRRVIFASQLWRRVRRTQAARP